MSNETTPWDIYAARTGVRGNTRRAAALIREQRNINNKLVDNLSYHQATINGVQRNVAIVSTDNLDKKYIYSLPGDSAGIAHGATVDWMNNHWLVIEKDYNTEVYTKAKMQQCNYLLKWVDDDDVVREQWCVISDGTKYMTGEMEDRSFFTTRGDSRIQVLIGRNEHTAKLNRDNRFIVDDPNSDRKLAYALTKPLKVGMTFGSDGVYSFILQEVQSTDNDNLELGIADYYKHFPVDSDDLSVTTEIRPDTTYTEDGRKVYL